MSIKHFILRQEAATAAHVACNR